MTEIGNIEDIVGFLSYVREDDKTDGGRITSLRRRLQAEVKMQTGDNFLIFQDREDIFTGQRWWSRVEKSIDESTLLISVITPSYLKSEACRSEVSLFADRERQLGRDDLIIPILYVNTPALSDVEDEVSTDLASRQYFDWTDLRFEDLESNAARRAIAELAGQMVAAIKRSQRSDRARIIPEESTVDEGPGFLELLAKAEEAMPLLNGTIVSLSEAQQQISEHMNTATAEMNAANKSGRPSSAKLAVIHRLSGRLEAPTSAMESLATEYLDELEHISGGIDAISQQIPQLDDQERQAAQKMLTSLRDLDQSVSEAFMSIEHYLEILGNSSGLSSTLRPVLRRISETLHRVLSSQPVFKSWCNKVSEALALWDTNRS